MSYCLGAMSNGGSGPPHKSFDSGLKINEVPQSNIIHIAYRSRHPEFAARILTDLNQRYLAKHLAVYRPAGIFDFFHQQTQHYQQELEAFGTAACQL